VNAPLLEASKTALAATLLWRREHFLRHALYEMQSAVETVFARHTLALLQALHDVAVAPRGEAVEPAPSRFADALARRRDEDVLLLAHAYEKAVAAALLAVEARWLVRIDSALLAAERWVEARARSIVESVGATTTRRVGRMLSGPLATPTGLSRSVEPTLRSTFGEKRVRTITRNETFTAYAWAELAAAGLFSDAGVPMLKRWYHTDGCPCTVCTSNDGQVVPLSGVFPSGHSTAPAHVHCECYVDVHPDPAAVLPAGLLVLGQTPYFSDDQIAA